MKIKFDSDDDFLLNRPVKLPTMTIIVRFVFEECVKYYPQVYLDECLDELKMLEYHRIHILEGVDINETSASNDICHYWYFKDISFKNEPYLCNGCHDLMQKAMMLL